MYWYYLKGVINNSQLRQVKNEQVVNKAFMCKLWWGFVQEQMLTLYEGWAKSS